MLKSYITTLQADTLTVVCEPEKGHELAVNSLSVFGGANGGYITISIGEFSMIHSIAANGRIVFPFFMGVPENMAIKAIATNDDIRVCASAEQFVADSPSDEPIPPVVPDEPIVPDYSNEPLTVTALEKTTINFIHSIPELYFSTRYDLEYKLNNNSWEKISFEQTFLLNEGEFIQFRNNKDEFSLTEDKPIRFLMKGKCNVSGLLRSLVNYSKEIKQNYFTQIFRSSDIVSAKNLILDFNKNPSFSFFNAFKDCLYLQESPTIGDGENEDNCFASMFKNCENLKEIRVNFSDWNNGTGDATANWVYGVASTGTFYKPKALPEEFGVNRIPEGWNVVNVDDYANMPLTIEALEPGVTVGVNIDFLENENLDIKYKTNNSAEWSTYNKGDIVSLTKTGDYVQFENKTTNWKVDGEDYHATPTDQKGCFIIEGGNVLVKGNARSLINYSTVLTDFCFCGLFLNCKTLKYAENLILDSNTLAQACYAYMLGRCDNLITMPKLPAENLANNCYRAMCARCVNLIKAEDLPSVNLAQACYAYMFAGCSNLTTAPLELPAYNTVSQCYMNMWGGCINLEIAPKILASRISFSSFDYMFGDCSKLREIEVHFTNWAENSPHGWLNGVASSGIFKKPTGLSEIFGISRIPEGWTVVNID